MIAQRFRALGWVAGIASAATCLYLTSLQVAAERATLEGVETAIVGARRDIRQLQTELGTRASMRQLEKWNGDVLAMSAPRADQYLHAESELASVGAREVRVPTGAISAAPIMLAAAQVAPPPVAAPQPVETPAPVMTAAARALPVAARPALQRASFDADSSKPANAPASKPAPKAKPTPSAKPPAVKPPAAKPKPVPTMGRTMRTIDRDEPTRKRRDREEPVHMAAAKPKVAPKATPAAKATAVKVASAKAATGGAKPKRAVLTKGALGDIVRVAANEGRRR